MMDICVVGLGRLGLPLAVQFAAKGNLVTGADTAPAVVDAVAAGRPPFPREAELDERLKQVVADVRVLLDGRRVTDPARWTAVRRIVVGGGG